MFSDPGSVAEWHASAAVAAEDREALPALDDSFPGLEHADAAWISSMSDAGALRTVAACEAAIARVQAVQLRALARLNEVRGGARGTDAEVALAVSSTESRARHQLELADTLRTRLPRTLAAMDSGTVDAYKASKIADATGPLDDVQAREADRALEPRLAGKNPSGLRQAAMRVVARVDPARAAERAAVRRRERRVELIHQPEGMATLATDLPAETASAIYARLDRLARAHHGGDEPRTLEQLRADALAWLCLGAAGKNTAATDSASATDEHATPGMPPASGQARAEVFVYVSAETLACASEAPGELAGHGPIPAALARHIAYRPNSTWRRILTDPATGGITDVGRTRYRPPAALDDLVRIRDRTCRHPGCHRPSHHGDLDHHRAWARDQGTTAEINLLGFCRKHHRLKDERGWRHDLDDDGTLRVTTPTGRTHTSTPDDPPF